jgi:hypothetical protein
VLFVSFISLTYVLIHTSCVLCTTQRFTKAHARFILHSLMDVISLCVKNVTITGRHHCKMSCHMYIGTIPNRLKVLLTYQLSITTNRILFVFLPHLGEIYACLLHGFPSGILSIITISIRDC